MGACRKRRSSLQRSRPDTFRTALLIINPAFFQEATLSDHWADRWEITAQRFRPPDVIVSQWGTATAATAETISDGGGASSEFPPDGHLNAEVT